MRPLSLLLFALAATPLTLHAQEAARQPSHATPAAPGSYAERPGGWQVRFDRAPTPDSAFKLEPAGPIWRVTTSPRGSAIAWRPAQTATGLFRVELETVMLPVSGEHAEGFGMIFGGTNLAADNQAYFYFLVRRDGQFLVKHRAGSEVHDIVNWTPHAAIARQEGAAQARNILAVEAARDSVTFFVNNQRVHALQRIPAGGIVGLRVNHGLDVQVTRLEVMQR
jgi:hypothetical protein